MKPETMSQLSTPPNFRARQASDGERIALVLFVIYLVMQLFIENV